MKAAKLPPLDPVTIYCRARGLPEPVREYRFAAGRRFAFDWAWPALRTALEREGGIYGRGKPCPVCKRRSVGAHTSIQRLKSDMEKYNLAALAGWVVLRARPEQIDSGEALDLVERALRAARELPVVWLCAAGIHHLCDERVCACECHSGKHM